MDAGVGEPGPDGLVLELLEVRLLPAEDDVHPDEEGIARDEASLPDALLLRAAREDAADHPGVVRVEVVREPLFARRKERRVLLRARARDLGEEAVEALGGGGERGVVDGAALVHVRLEDRAPVGVREGERRTRRPGRGGETQSATRASRTVPAAARGGREIRSFTGDLLGRAGPQAALNPSP